MRMRWDVLKTPRWLDAPMLGLVFTVFANLMFHFFVELFF